MAKVEKIEYMVVKLELNGREARALLKLLATTSPATCAYLGTTEDDGVRIQDIYLALSETMEK